MQITSYFTVKVESLNAPCLRPEEAAWGTSVIWADSMQCVKLLEEGRGDACPIIGSSAEPETGSSSEGLFGGKPGYRPGFVLFRNELQAIFEITLEYWAVFVYNEYRLVFWAALCPERQLRVKNTMKSKGVPI